MLHCSATLSLSTDLDKEQGKILFSDAGNVIENSSKLFGTVHILRTQNQTLKSLLSQKIFFEASREQEGFQRSIMCVLAERAFFPGNSE
jgi:hypothetical protein